MRSRMLPIALGSRAGDQLRCLQPAASAASQSIRAPRRPGRTFARRGTCTQCCTNPGRRTYTRCRARSKCGPSSQRSAKRPARPIHDPVAQFFARYAAVHSRRAARPIDGPLANFHTVQHRAQQCRWLSTSCPRQRAKRRATGNRRSSCPRGGTSSFATARRHSTARPNRRRAVHRNRRSRTTFPRSHRPKVHVCR